MVSEFLRNKWYAGFMANDVNKDGVISVEDANLFSDRFIKQHKMSDERAARLKSEFRAYWEDLFMYGRKEISPETFVDLMTEEYRADKEKFKERMFKSCQTIVDIFDANGDGKISYDEYMVVLKCWGVDNFDHKTFMDAFPQFPPGYVAKEVYRDSWLAFLTNTDEKNCDLERPGLYCFNMIDKM